MSSDKTVTGLKSSGDRQVLAYDLIPAVADAFDIGTAALKWQDIFGNNGIFSNQLNVAGLASITNLSVSGIASFLGTLNVVNLVASGNVSAVGISASGTVTGSSVVASTFTGGAYTGTTFAGSGNISSSAGNISGVNVTASGTVTGTTSVTSPLLIGSTSLTTPIVKSSSTLSLQTNGATAAITISDAQLVSVLGALYNNINENNVGLVVDAGGAARLGIIKKAGDVPVVAFSNNSTLKFQVSNSSNVTSVSSNTYTTVMSISSAGVCDVPVQITTPLITATTFTGGAYTGSTFTGTGNISTSAGNISGVNLTASGTVTGTTAVTSPLITGSTSVTTPIIKTAGTTLTVNLAAANTHVFNSDGCLQWAGSSLNRKILLQGNKTDNLNYSIGVESFGFRFNIDGTSTSYRWYTATSTTTETQLMSLSGLGALTVSGSLSTQAIFSSNAVYTPLIGTQSAIDLVFSPNSTEALRINSSTQNITTTANLTAAGTVTGTTAVTSPLVTGSTSVTTPIVKSSTSLTFQTNGSTNALTINTSQNVGIGTTSPSSKLTINPIVVDSAAFDHSGAPLTITHPTGTSASVLNDQLPVLHLTRQGTNGQAYGSRATFALSRYENSSTNSRTRLDIRLSQTTYNQVDVMSIRGDGRVGIGTKTPGSELDVVGTITGSTSVIAPIFKSASTLKLQSNGSTDAVHIDTSQNVGIGNTSPSYKLDVTGVVKGTSLISSNTSFVEGGRLIEYANTVDTPISNSAAITYTTDQIWSGYLLRTNLIANTGDALPSDSALRTAFSAKGVALDYASFSFYVMNNSSFTLTLTAPGAAVNVGNRTIPANQAREFKIVFQVVSGYYFIALS